MAVVCIRGWLALAVMLVVLCSDKVFASTADHAFFETLQGPFATGPEVTKACLACHTEAAKQFQKTRHWTWSFNNPATGQKLGKGFVINNYCISAVPNIQECASCHPGYGWNEPGVTFTNFDFGRQESVDCLVCHDTTGTYSRAALIDPGNRKPDLAVMAQQVGPTSRKTCGTCHFAGGGDKGVKHGDIDPTLERPDVFVDVHMSPEGVGLNCSTCHSTDAHDIRGSRYASTAVGGGSVIVPGRSHGNRVICQGCHGATPHAADGLLDRHGRKVACETCHIPLFARGDYSTKMWWDWSEAGLRDDKGSPLTQKDALGQEVYSGKKGRFVWERDVVPEYRWFNGTVHYTLLDDPIHPDRTVSINSLGGGPLDPGSRIAPFKVMRGRQPYDTVSNTLVAPQTTGDKGYWKTFDWQSSIQLGMEAVGRSFSGHYGFVDTEMYWPINHMVAPKRESLMCNDCHNARSRLAGMPGIYLFGHTKSADIEAVGLGLMALTLLVTVLHGGARLIAKLRYRSSPRTTVISETQSLLLFTPFERIWHWSQALLVIGMIATGFEVHGSVHLLGFESAAGLHRLLAWGLLGLWALAMFWHAVTGEWRQYLPSGSAIPTVRYYLIGIFQGAAHPFRVSRQKKHNPLQRSAYLTVLTVLMPLLWLSGLLCLFVVDFEETFGRSSGLLEKGAMVHTFLGYLMVSFLIGHLYLITLGTPWYAEIVAMIKGWHRERP